MTKMKSTLISVDENLLINYTSYNNVNKNWNISSYLNTFYDLNAAIAFSKLYFPDFFEVKQCILLSFNYNEEIFNEWYKEFDGDIVQIEKICNLYDLNDFFHINNVEFELQDGYDKALEVFGNILKKSWELCLQNLYSNRKFIVEIFSEYDSKQITFYSI